MVNQDPLIERDLRHIWHPCSQMKDFEQFPPLIVHQAKGSILYTDKGPIIDAISSWWCKSLGHGNPQVITAIQEQLSRFEHVIGANTTFPQLVELGEEFAKLSGKQHVFFANDGASAVEIAMKLTLQANLLKGQSQRRKFISLRNSYHGETLGTISVSDVSRFTKGFTGFGVDCHFIQNIPYVHSKHDPLWDSCATEWAAIVNELDVIKEEVCAVIVEPIVQGVGGMRPYSADFLCRLGQWAQDNHIYLIADEIMTGLGRTGKWLASEHADIEPDLVCLSKGLTSGSLPLSCVLIDHAIFELFYADYSQGKSFLHSHTFSGNPLAVSAALATIRTMREININQKAQDLGSIMIKHFTNIAEKTGKLNNIRSIGALVAGDLQAASNERKGFQVFQEAIARGAFLRPIGNTLYWLPPITTTEDIIEQLAEITLHSIEAVYT